MTKILVFVIFYFHGAQASIKLNSIRKTKKKILGTIARSKYHQLKSQKNDFGAVFEGIYLPWA